MLRSLEEIPCSDDGSILIQAEEGWGNATYKEVLKQTGRYLGKVASYLRTMETAVTAVPDEIVYGMAELMK